MLGRTTISLLSCALALTLGACGSGDGTIPQEKSDALLSLLSATEGAVSDGECDRAQEFAQEFVAEADDLPSEVDPKVAKELSTAASNLDTLANNPDQCTTSGATGETGAVEPATTSPETAVETTTDEEPTTTDEEATTTDEPQNEQPSEPTQTPQPPAGGDGGDGGSPSVTPGGGIEPPSGDGSGGKG